MAGSKIGPRPPEEVPTPGGGEGQKPLKVEQKGGMGARDVTHKREAPSEAKGSKSKQPREVFKSTVKPKETAADTLRREIAMLKIGIGKGKIGEGETFVGSIIKGDAQGKREKKGVDEIAVQQAKLDNLQTKEGILQRVAQLKAACAALKKSGNKADKQEANVLEKDLASIEKRVTERMESPVYQKVEDLKRRFAQASYADDMEDVQNQINSLLKEVNNTESKGGKIGDLRSQLMHLLDQSEGKIKGFLDKETKTLDRAINKYHDSNWFQEIKDLRQRLEKVDNSSDLDAIEEDIEKYCSMLSSDFDDVENLELAFTNIVDRRKLELLGEEFSHMSQDKLQDYRSEKLEKVGTAFSAILDRAKITNAIVPSFKFVRGPQEESVGNAIKNLQQKLVDARLATDDGGKFEVKEGHSELVDAYNELVDYYRDIRLVEKYIRPGAGGLEDIKALKGEQEEQPSLESPRAAKKLGLLGKIPGALSRAHSEVKKTIGRAIDAGDVDSSSSSVTSKKTPPSLARRRSLGDFDEQMAAGARDDVVGGLKGAGRAIGGAIHKFVRSGNTERSDSEEGGPAAPPPPSSASSSSQGPVRPAVPAGAKPVAKAAGPAPKEDPSKDEEFGAVLQSLRETIISANLEEHQGLNFDLLGRLTRERGNKEEIRADLQKIRDAVGNDSKIADQFKLAAQRFQERWGEPLQ